MLSNQLAVKYAQALYELAAERDMLGRVQQELEVVAETLRQHGDLGTLIYHPRVLPQAKKDTLRKIFADEVQSFVLNFLLLLVDKRRETALPGILQDYTKLNLNGTFLAIWLAHTGFGLPLAIYLLFNYISQLPRETLEAAFVDGASHFTIFTQLILPLAVPALASFAIFQFLWVWNDYLVALIFLGDKNRVVTMALAAMVGEKGQDWHLLTSGAFISMILPLAVFFALQRFFVRGLTAGSVKG